jgi:hypothetical protein
MFLRVPPPVRGFRCRSLLHMLPYSNSLMPSKIVPRPMVAAYLPRCLVRYLFVSCELGNTHDLSGSFVVFKWICTFPPVLNTAALTVIVRAKEVPKLGSACTPSSVACLRFRSQRAGMVPSNPRSKIATPGYYRLISQTWQSA